MVAITLHPEICDKCEEKYFTFRNEAMVDNRLYHFCPACLPYVKILVDTFLSKP